jgi:hypothetical protein
MPERPAAKPQPYSSVAALAMARAQKRLAEKYQDSDLANRGASLEARALDAIKQGSPILPPVEALPPHEVTE